MKDRLRISALTAVTVMAAALWHSASAFADEIRPIPEPKDYGIDPHSPPNIAGLPWWLALLVLISAVLTWRAYWKATLRSRGTRR